jgi:hypothetical protein
MRKLVGLFIVGAFLVGAAGIASADDEGPNFTFGASTSYAYDMHNPDANNPARPNNSIFYPNMENQDESFNIDLVQIGINGERGNVGYAATIDLGDLAAFAGDSADGDIALQTAYITYDFDGVGATAGRFGTPIGYEVLEPWGNPNISRSRGWQAQPINHDGLTISGSADVVDLMIGVVNNFTVNDAQNGINDFDSDLGVIGSIGAGLSDEVSIYVSGIYTEDDSTFPPVPNSTTEIIMGNLIISGNVNTSEDTAIRYAVEGNWRQNDPDLGDSVEMKNVAGYLGTDVGVFGIDMRLDWTDDEGITTPIDTKVWSVTVTGSVALADGVEFRLEYRHDDADDPIFADDNGTDEAMDLVQAQLVWAPEVD